MKKILIVTICTFLISCNSKQKKIDNNDLNIIKKVGYIFKSDVFCGESNNFINWDVSGDVIDENTFKEMYIRNFAKNSWPGYSNSLTLNDLKSKFISEWKYISDKCENGNKFFLLFYEGKYKCEHSEEIKNDTLMAILRNNVDVEFLDDKFASGP